MSSLLIVFEGLDGIGKSAQIQLIQQGLNEAKISCQFLHFPRIEHPSFGPLIKKYLNGEFGSLQTISPYLIATLYMNDQYLACRDTLNKNPVDVTLLDRYYYSNRAYQGARISNEEERQEFYRWFDRLLEDFHIIQPHMALFLDVPLDFQYDNLKNRTNKDLHENSFEYQLAVHDEYIKMCNCNWHKLKTISCSDQNTILSSWKNLQDVVLNYVVKNK